jgi:hypothetical protein
MDAARALGGVPGVQRLIFGSLDFQVDLDIEVDAPVLLRARTLLERAGQV